MKKGFILMGMVLFISFWGVLGIIPMGDDEHVDFVYEDNHVDEFLCSVILL